MECRRNGAWSESPQDEDCARPSSNRKLAANRDGGNLLLLKAFGCSDVIGITFAFLRRFHELVWVGIGLLCLAMIGKNGIEQEQF